MKDYAKLTELLKTTESFPLDFTFKFIGRKSDAFLASVQALEAQFPPLRREGERESANQQHLSLTYSFKAAPTAEILIEVYRSIEKLRDVLVVL